MNQQDVQSLALVILEYYKQNPNAGETVEGIQYWLTRSRYEDSLAQVQAALDYLVDRGYLLKKVRNKHTLYFRAEIPQPPTRD